MPDTVHPIAERFGEVVRKRRLELGFSQEELAERAELHRTYVSLVERGHRTPTLSAVECLARALETSMAALVNDSEVQR